MGLSPKQKIFVDVYDGNALEAARQAGYKLPRISSVENMQKPAIVKAIAKRNKKATDNRIYTREQRQQFWTDVLSGKIGEKGLNEEGNEVETPAALRERIKASELLGRSEADFIDRKHHTGELIVKVITRTIIDPANRLKK